MSKTNNTATPATPVASAAVRKAYNAAKAAEAKGYGAFVSFISNTAKEAFQTPITVATFAAFVGDDLGVGKDVSAEDKAERNRIRARIRYALESVDMLEEKARSPQQGKGGKAAKSKGKAAADAVEHANETATTNPSNRFSAVCSILRAMDRNELLRVANEVASLIAAATTAKAEPAKEAKPARQRKAKAA